MERQCGRTTQQIETAPPGSVFVWCNQHLEYPIRLARQLGRHDLRIVSPAFLGHGCRGYSGTVVLDHAAYEMMAEQQREAYEWLRKRSESLAKISEQG